MVLTHEFKDGTYTVRGDKQMVTLEGEVVTTGSFEDTFNLKVREDVDRAIKYIEISVLPGDRPFFICKVIRHAKDAGSITDADIDKMMEDLGVVL